MINKAILIGRLGQDPELRHTTNGTAVCTLSVATSESYKDKGGIKQEKTEWHRVVVWERKGEVCAEFLNKGSQVYIEGKIQTRSWDDQQGNKRYATEILAQSVQFLDNKKREDNQDTSNSNQYQNVSTQIDSSYTKGNEFRNGLVTIFATRYNEPSQESTQRDGYS